MSLNVQLCTIKNVGLFDARMDFDVLLHMAGEGGQRLVRFRVGEHLVREVLFEIGLAADLGAVILSHFQYCY